MDLHTVAISNARSLLVSSFLLVLTISRILPPSQSINSSIFQPATKGNEYFETDLMYLHQKDGRLSNIYVHDCVGLCVYLL